MCNNAKTLLLGKNMKDCEFRKLCALSDFHDVVNMQYISGTTVFSKGNVYHHNITNNYYHTVVHMKFTSYDKYCICVPLLQCVQYGCVTPCFD